MGFPPDYLCSLEHMTRPEELLLGIKPWVSVVETLPLRYIKLNIITQGLHSLCSKSSMLAAAASVLPLCPHRKRSGTVLSVGVDLESLGLDLSRSHHKSDDLRHDEISEGLELDFDLNTNNSWLLLDSTWNHLISP